MAREEKIEPYAFNPGAVTSMSGFCYIIEFSNGIIKPGKTINLLARFNQHKLYAKSKGIHIERVAITSQHDDYSKTEHVILGELRKVSSGWAGEYLSGADFDECIGMVRSLGVDLIVASEIISVSRDEITLRIRTDDAERVSRGRCKIDGVKRHPCGRIKQPPMLRIQLSQNFEEAERLQAVFESRIGREKLAAWLKMNDAEFEQINDALINR